MILASLLPMLIVFCVSAGHAEDRGCERYFLAVAERAPDRLVAGVATRMPTTLIVFMDLARVYRTGFRRAGVPDAVGETVYRHSLRLVEATTYYAPERPGARLLSLVHDFPERTVFDYTPFDPITPAAKFAEEEAAMVRLTETLGPDGRLLLKWWREFESRATRESVIVNQLDKLAAGVQALEYDRAGYDVAQFFETIPGHLQDVRLREVWAELQRYRRRPRIDFHDVYHALLRGERIAR